MTNRILCAAAVAAVALTSSGCVVRTYQVARDRVDQDLEVGNRGYLHGAVPATFGEQERKSTRATRTVEIELRNPLRFERRAGPKAAAVQDDFPVQEEAMFVEDDPGQVPAGVTMQPYTVQKNDTLQKISQKFYGTTKKWMRIFEANKGALSAPDKIYPGQVIQVPVDNVAGNDPKLK